MQRDPIWTRPFVLAFVGNFSFTLGFWTFVHLPGYLEVLGGGHAEIGLIVGVLSVSAIVCRPSIGRLMDRRGRRPVAFWGAAINLAAVAAYLSADSLGPLIYAIRIVHGIGQAALFSALFTIAADVIPAGRRTEGIAVFGISGLLPLSLGGLLGDGILAYWNYDALFAAATGISLVALLICRSIPETRPAPRAGSRHRSLRAIFFLPELIPPWILTFGFACGLTSYFTFIKTYIGQVNVGSVGLFFLAYSATAVVTRLFFAWIPERLGAKQTLVPTLFILVSGIFLLANAGHASTVAIAGSLCGLGHAYVFPIASALIVSRAPEDSRGAAMTLFTALFDAGPLLGAPVFGWIVERTDYQTMFMTAIGIVLVLSTLFFALDRRAPSRT